MVYQTSTSPDEPINEPRPRFLGYMTPGSGRGAIAISWIFYIFTPTTNCQLPRTTNGHNAHAQQAPQRARSRSKWRRGGGRPTPDAYRTPNGAYPGAGALVNYGRKLSPRILLPQTGNRKKSSLRKGELGCVARHPRYRINMWIDNQRSCRHKSDIAVTGRSSSLRWQAPRCAQMPQKKKYLQETRSRLLLSIVVVCAG